jgi:hypothetical protein
MAKPQFPLAKKFLKEAGFEKCVDVNDLKRLEEILSCSLPMRWDANFPEKKADDKVLGELSHEGKLIFYSYFVTRCQFLHEILTSYLEARFDSRLVQVCKGGVLVEKFPPIQAIQIILTFL